MNLISAKEAASQTLQARQTIIDKNLAALPNLMLTDLLPKIKEQIEQGKSGYCMCLTYNTYPTKLEKVLISCSQALGKFEQDLSDLGYSVETVRDHLTKFYITISWK